MADSGNHDLRVESEPGREYALSGKIMLSAIVVLFAVVVFLAGLHLYARWYALRLRRLQLQRRRVRRTQIVRYVDSRLPADRGLDRDVMNSLPVFLHAPPPEPDQLPPECAVCISEFEEGVIGRVLPKCGHSFHIDCIDMWFRSHSTCPLCRSPVEQVVVHRPSGKEGEAEPSSSSGSAANLLGARKGLTGVRIEVPPRSVEPENESVHGSPASRILSRIMSMGRRSPASAPSGTGEIDLESGPSLSNRVRSPN